MKEIIDIIAKLRSKKIAIFLDDSGQNIRLKGDVKSLTDQDKNEIKVNKSKLVAFFNEQLKDKLIPKVVEQANYAMSNAQRRLWLASQFEEVSKAYNSPFYIPLEEGFDGVSLEKAIHALIERHEILRTVFKEDKSGEVRQVILSAAELNFEIVHVDLVKDSADTVENYTLSDTGIRFDLENGPLIRVAIINAQNGEYGVYFNIHHIISDGWSLGIIKRDIFAFYQAFKNNKNHELAALRIQYKDYASWQVRQLNSPIYAEHQAFWKQYLFNEIPLVDLPSNKERGLSNTFKGRKLETFLNAKLTKELKAFGAKNEVSLFVTLLTVWQVLIQKYTSLNDVVVGTTVAGRNHQDLKNQIGFYINVFPIRSHIEADQSFKRLIQTVKQNVLSCLEHQDYPFDSIVEDLALMRDKNRHPIFDVILTLENVHESNEVFSLTDKETAIIKDQGAIFAKFEIDITFQEFGDHLYFRVNYNEEVYDKRMVEGFIRHFKILLANLLSNSENTIKDADYLMPSEKEAILAYALSNHEAVTNPKSIIEQFERQAAHTPNATAIKIEEQTMSYDVFNKKVNQLSAYLIENFGSLENQLVGIQLPRGEGQILSVFAILKSGGAYVPIDMGYPAERFDYIQSNSGFEHLIDESFLNLFEVEFEDYSDKNPNIQRTMDTITYVIYTSGSTGNPKGVVLKDKSVLNYLNWASSYYLGDEPETFAYFTSLSFDLTVTSLFTTLLTGGSVRIYNAAENMNKVLSKIYAPESDVDLVKMTPSHVSLLNSLNVSSTSVKKVILGGEPLRTLHLAQLGKLNPSILIYNEYGPTETTVGTTIEQLKPTADKITIGKPITNVEAYVLDPNQQLVGKGISGELYLGGDCLSAGYLNNKSLTNEAFVPNPFDATTLLYRTGDVCRWLEDGSLEYIGRIDDQVKIRGNRVELGEIDKLIENYDGVVDNIVLARLLGEDNELITYYYGTVSEADLRAYVAAKLPAYMVPSYFVKLDGFPLTLNGKIDKKALPDPRKEWNENANVEAPRDEVEENLVAIWKKVLKVDKIGINSDFFELGGQSMKATRLASRIKRKFDVKIDIGDLIGNPKLEMQAQLIKNANEAVFVAIPKLEAQESYTISDAQRRLWVLSQFDEGLVAYNVPFRIELAKAYNIENFKKAIHAVIERHEILRTVFRTEENGDVRQWVLSSEKLKFELDYQDFQSKVDQQKQVDNYISNDSYKAFDLENGPLLRASLLQLSSDQYVFYFNMHHIISDGWSMKVLTKDVNAFYEAFEQNETPALPVLDIQYKDYAAWQQEQLSGTEYEVHKTYWLDQFKGVIPHIDLPVNNVRPAVKSYNGHSLSTCLSKEATQGLKDFCQQEGGSLFMGLLASWNVLLSRYTGSKDLIIGTPIAGREHLDLENQIGFYVNTLALRNEVDHSASFTNHFQSVRENTLKGYSHQMYPFDRLVDDLDLQRDTSRNPLFDLMLTLIEQEIENKAGSSSQDENQIKDNGPISAKFDLNITGVEAGEQLEIYMMFNSDIYTSEMIEGLLVHYKSLLNELLHQPNTELSGLDYLLETEKQQLLETFNTTTFDYPNDKTVVDLFAVQVNETPDSVAFVFQEHEITYVHLDEFSNQFADFLLSKTAIEVEDFISITLDKSEWLLVVILGVLKTGAAYVPIDPTYPKGRITYIKEDTNCKLNITPVLLDEFLANRETYSTKPIPSKTVATDLAYVMYTSGSTGAPKGVMVEHQSIIRLVKSANFYQCDATDVLLSTGAFSFDATTFEYWGMLLNGGRVVITDQETLLKPELLAAEIQRQSVNVMFFTVGWFNQLVETNIEVFEGLKTLMVGGDRLSPNRIETLKTSRPTINIMSCYGPTENTTFSTTYVIEEVVGEIPLGSCISNGQAYVLDDHLNLCPIGVKGEICLSGDGLSRGYLNKEELTAEKFVTNPFNPSTRLYKTGDMGRWSPSGILEFVERKDDQIKVRGFRIELGEIELALLSQDAIDGAVVLALETEGEKELVAYLTSKQEQNISGLREGLKELLPHYMLPAHFVQLQSFPLNSNGKVDKRALPSPKDLGLSSGVEYVAPTNEIEEQLVTIWQNILEKEQIGIKDDFFALGGHSLKATRLISEYHKAFHVKLNLKDLFANAVLESHVALIKRAEEKTFIAIPKLTEQDNYAISDAQRRLWVLSQFEEGSVAYNMPFPIELESNYNIENFKKAIHAVIERHEILRTVFKTEENGTVRQKVLSSSKLNFELNYQDYQAVEDPQAKVKKYIAADSYKAFDLENGPLLRATLLQLAKAHYVFYFNMHHIISDGWSMKVLFKDVIAFYEAFEKDEKPNLPELRIQYKDYAAWQLEEFSKPEFGIHKDYWLNKLSGELKFLDLPMRQPRPAINTRKGRKLVTYIDAETTSKLKRFTRDQEGSLFMTLLATWNVLLANYTAENDIIIGTPNAGRDHVDLADQIGFYINVLALRNKVDFDEKFTSFYQKVKDSTINSFKHQVYPFDRLVDELDLKKNRSRNPIFDVILTLQNVSEKQEGIKVSASEVEKIVDNGEIFAKFDIDMTFQEVGDNLYFRMSYNEEVYAQEMIERLIVHYKQFLSNLLNNTDVALGTIDYLLPTEEAVLIGNAQSEIIAFPKTSIVDLFENQVKNTPTNIALKQGDNNLTYSAFNEKINQFAAYLIEEHNIEPGDLVGIQLPSGEGQLSSVFALLKCGAAYLPLDVDYPAERIDYITQDSGLKFIVDETILSLFAVEAESYSAKNKGIIRNEFSQTYVIYTSGSTGEPKGVSLLDGSVLNYLNWAKGSYLSNAPETFAYFTSLSFDLTVTSLFTTLLSGGSVRIYEAKQSINDVLTAIYHPNSDVDLVKMTPSHTSLLSSLELERTAVNKVILGGEQLRKSHLKELGKLNPAIRIFNEYGPTETTVGTLFAELKASSEEIVVGRPIANVTAYILDKKQDLIGEGITGELYLGGACLAQGYINNESLTNEKFLDNPFSKSEKIYKTGDLCKWLPDGSIAYVGRIDDQVKIRGNRVELGEIEAIINEYEGVAEVITIAQVLEEENELIAYYKVAAENSVLEADLRAYLALKLPPYMVPSYFVQLATFPLTLNGKVDKNALPDPRVELNETQQIIAPNDATEEALVEIWKKVLKVDEIGINSDFFELGGQSMKATRLASRIKRKFDVKIDIGDLIGNPKLAAQAALIKNAKQLVFEAIPKLAEQNAYVISDAQRRLWVLSQFEQGSIAYNMPFHNELNASYNVESFQKAIHAVIERHEILRTVFKAEENGEVKQRILSPTELNFELDFQDYQSEEDQEELVKKYIATDSKAAFDLDNGPLLRAALLQISAEKYVFYFNMHHIISDGWSMEVLTKDMMAFYEAFGQNTTPTLPSLTIQYKDYAAWQQNQLSGKEYEAHKTYWLKQFEGELPHVDLPASKVRPTLQTHNGHSISTFLSKETTAALKNYSQQEGGSLFMGFLASWNVLLSRYSGTNDLIIGSPIAGREHLDLENQIGFYVNTLALRNTVVHSGSFNKHFNSVKENTLRAYSHQIYPFDRLVEDLDLHRDTSRNPLFDVMLTLHSNEGYASSYDDQHISDNGTRTAKFDLNITGSELGEQLGIDLTFNADIYSVEMIEGLLLHYKSLLTELLNQPTAPLATLDYLSAPEKLELVETFNATTCDYPKAKSVVDLFAAQVKATPNAIAVVFANHALTYADLEAQSNQFAHFLLSKSSITSEDFISIKLERNEWLMVTILGVLKTGAAYVPIDTTYPVDRIAFIEQDTNCKLSIDAALLDEFTANKETFSTQSIENEISAKNLAYVMYTSGSTGTPKGVMVEHQNIVRLVKSANFYQCTSSDTLLSTGAFSFDATTFEYWGMLLNGGRLVLTDQDTLLKPELLSAEIKRQAVNVMWFTAGWFNQLIETNADLFQDLKTVLVGGDKLSPNQIAALKTSCPDIQIINGYGPTENTTFSLTYDINEVDGDIPIGSPISNSQAYILDAQLNLCPIGVAGEICLSGDGLSRGYLNQEELTNEKFVTNPFNPASRLYKTGDLGKWTADGIIEFIGRKDDQVKIRGFRIELGEIEHALLSQAAIDDAVVIVVETETDKELVAYLTSKAAQTSASLRESLKAVLPAYMIPNHFVQLDAFPLNSNGKVDKRALPSPKELGLSSGVEYIAPSNETEEKLVAIWEKVLNREGIGIKDNFFELGGHSLKATKIISMIQKEFKVKLNIQELFLDPTLENIADNISNVAWDYAELDENVEEFKI